MRIPCCGRQGESGASSSPKASGAHPLHVKMESTDEYTRRSAAADVAPTAPAPAATAAQRLATRRFTMRAAPQILPMTPAEHRLVHALQNSQRPSNLRGLLTAVLLAKNRAAGQEYANPR
eukprot:GHVT01047999.1.p4 GENE.GHVT01047999.1~~GHVT01047999.1.p4  ORF type:complete len:120 (+),score=23.10 GHVT01047999.1:1158-1517(+)